MRSLNDKVAVVTGSASGIGRALAFALAREGCHLALADTNVEGMAETAPFARQEGGDATTHRLDVSRRDDVYGFSEEVVRSYGRVEVVINNAGVALAETVADLTYEDFEWIMKINF